MWIATTCIGQDPWFSPPRPRRKDRRAGGQSELASGRFRASQRRGYDLLVLLGVNATR